MHRRAFIFLSALVVGAGFAMAGMAVAGETSGEKRFKLNEYELVYKERPKDYGYSVEWSRSGAVLLKMEPDECATGDPIGVIVDKPVKGCQGLLGYCFSGGAHCCTTAMLLTLCGSEQTLTTVQLEHSSEIQWTDINEDGTSELGVADWSFAYYSIDPNSLDSDLFLPFAFSPAFRRLGVWEGEKGWRSDRPGEFESFHAGLLEETLSDLKTLHVNEEEPQAITAHTIQATYYALMAGEGEERAEELLKSFLPPSWQPHREKLMKDIKASVEGFNPFEPVPVSSSAGK